MNLLLSAIIFILLLLFIVRYLIGVYNKIVMLKSHAEKAFANIDVLLKQRADEIPQLIKVAEKIMSHQSELFIQLAQLRSRYLSSQQSEEKVRITNQTDRLLKEVWSISESYPELKAMNNMLELQQRVALLESKIADRREFFNESVALYNIGIREFPNIIFAMLLGYKTKTMLSIAEEEKHYAGVTL